MWLVPKIWDGADVWILGGGPSVASSFGIPAQLIYDVRTGAKPITSFSPYMEAIHGKHVIGINVAYKIGNWLDMMFCGDKGFLLKHQEELKSFPGLKLSCHSHAQKLNHMKFVPKDSRKPFGISPNPYKVSWNLNSGAAAISLAAHTGAKRIILLGFDMNLENETQHFHDEYKKGLIESNKQKRGLPFQRHLKGFPVIKRDADAMGIEIINCSLHSAVNAFQKVDIKELL
jgi:hypothetical protein